MNYFDNLTEKRRNWNSIVILHFMLLLDFDLTSYI